MGENMKIAAVPSTLTVQLHPGTTFVIDGIYPFFFPEDKKTFTLFELKAIIEEMEKLENANLR
jgi:hypothetical protein